MLVDSHTKTIIRQHICNIKFSLFSFIISLEKEKLWSPIMWEMCHVHRCLTPGVVRDAESAEGASTPPASSWTPNSISKRSNETFYRLLDFQDDADLFSEIMGCWTNGLLVRWDLFVLHRWDVRVMDWKLGSFPPAVRLIDDEVVARFAQRKIHEIDWTSIYMRHGYVQKNTIKQ